MRIDPFELQRTDLPIGYRNAVVKYLPRDDTRFPEDRVRKDAANAREFARKGAAGLLRRRPKAA